MSAPPVVVEVPSTHVDRVPAFVDYDGGGHFIPDLEVKRYPPSPRGRDFRSLRLERRLTLGDVARALGVSVVEASGLERGSHAFEDWDAGMRFLASVRSSPPSR